MPDAIFTIGLGTLDRGVLAVFAGVVAAWLWLLPAKPGASPASPLPSTGLMGIVLLSLLLTALLDLVLRSAAMAEVSVADVWPLLPKVIQLSDYGHWWSWRLGIWAVLWVTWLYLWRQGVHKQGVWLLTLGGALTLFFISTTGHAGTDGSLTLANLMNTLHLISSGLWGGAVLVYVYSLLPRLLAPHVQHPLLALSAQRLSSLAGTALALVLATGLYNAWHQIPTFSALWTSAYGRILLLKLALVAGMMAIGAINRFFIVPAIEVWASTRSEQQPSPAWRFLQLLRVDAILFIFILACATTLSTQNPPQPGEPAHRHVELTPR